MPLSSVQFSSVVQSCPTLCAPRIAACQASLSVTNSWSLLKFMSIKSVMPSSHLILCRPLFLLPPNPSSIRIFSKESTLHMRWQKSWSLSFSIIPFKEHPGLISFRMDWLDLLAVQGTHNSLLQHHSSKASIYSRETVVFSTSASVLTVNTQDLSPLGWTGWISLLSKGLSRVFNTTVQKYQFFSAQLSLMVQLSYPYMTTGKTMALTRQAFIGKVMSLLFNILSGLIIAFLPKSKCLLISWL